MSGPVTRVGMAAASQSQSVRPITSGLSRQTMAAGLGFGAATGLAVWADQRYDMPDADGTSVGRIDRYEAREMFTGRTGVPVLLSFTALLPVSILYSHLRRSVTPGELSFLQHAGYAAMGGVLLGTMVAPAMLPELPPVPRGIPATGHGPAPLPAGPRTEPAPASEPRIVGPDPRQ